MSERAVVEVPTTALREDITLLEATGFQLDAIFPADAPRVAELSGHGLRVRLDCSSSAGAPRIVADVDEAVELSSGTTVQPVLADPSIPALNDIFVHTVGGDWGTGRAGMLYRDLIPQRHGGRVVASHIRIAEAGPVPDYVHHHDVRFQMIYCRRGRVELVYEDQGEPFWMTEGDCILQPPHIRHRVLSSSDGLEVIEIASPAEHATHIDHEITLPTAHVNPVRDFGGQRFSVDRAEDAEWVSDEPGWDQRVTDIGNATAGIASVRIIRATGTSDSLCGSHDGDLCLFFVLNGEATLSVGDYSHLISTDDAVTVPRNESWALTARTDGFVALNVNISNEKETRHGI